MSFIKIVRDWMFYPPSVTPAPISAAQELRPPVRIQGRTFIYLGGLFIDGVAGRREKIKLEPENIALTMSDIRIIRNYLNRAGHKSNIRYEGRFSHGIFRYTSFEMDDYEEDLGSAAAIISMPDPVVETQFTPGPSFYLGDVLTPTAAPEPFRSGGGGDFGGGGASGDWPAEPEVRATTQDTMSAFMSSVAVAQETESCRREEYTPSPAPEPERYEAPAPAPEPERYEAPAPEPAPDNSSYDSGSSDSGGSTSSD